MSFSSLIVRDFIKFSVVVLMVAFAFGIIVGVIIGSLV